MTSIDNMVVVAIATNADEAAVQRQLASAITARLPRTEVTGFGQRYIPNGIYSGGSVYFTRKVPRKPARLSWLDPDSRIEWLQIDTKPLGDSRIAITAEPDVVEKLSLPTVASQLGYQLVQAQVSKGQK